MATPSPFTTFTPPPDCLSNTYRYGDNQLVGPMTSTCYLPGWTNSSTTYYSPGACPSGYTTGCITANTAGSVTETVATCCPSDFICASSGNALGCRSTIVGGKPQLMTVMDDSFVSPSTTKTQTIGGNVNAYGVQIRFQATDLAPTTSTESNSGRYYTGSYVEPPSGGSSLPTDTPSHGLSTGAKAGIGVGAALAGLIFLIALFLGWRFVRRRRSAGAAHNGGGTKHGDTEPKSYPGAAEHGGLHEAPGEAKYNGPYETGVEDARGELPAQSELRRHELAGDGR